MSKRKIHKEINRSFYNLIETQFTHLSLNFNEGGGIVYIHPHDWHSNFNNNDEMCIMAYHQQQHYLETSWKKDTPEPYIVVLLRNHLKLNIIPEVFSRFPGYEDYKDILISKI